jgi:hypothetical protein
MQKIISLEQNPSLETDCCPDEKEILLLSRKPIRFITELTVSPVG